MPIGNIDRLKSNNTAGFGIVAATEIAGHRTVATKAGLYSIPDPILSLSAEKPDQLNPNDAIGQLWYVVEEGKFYQLIDWDARHSEAGWAEFSSGIKIVSSESELESTAAQGSMAIVVSGSSTIIYLKGADSWGKFVVDDLTTEDSNRPLSAKQGKELKGRITEIEALPSQFDTFKGEVDDSIAQQNTTIADAVNAQNNTIEEVRRQFIDTIGYILTTQEF